jgi:hypothetical protein
MLGVYHPVGRGPRNKKIIGNLSKVFYRPPCWELNDKGKVRLQKTAPGWH